MVGLGVEMEGVTFGGGPGWGIPLGGEEIGGGAGLPPRGDATATRGEAPAGGAVPGVATPPDTVLGKRLAEFVYTDPWANPPGY